MRSGVNLGNSEEAQEEALVQHHPRWLNAGREVSARARETECVYGRKRGRECVSVSVCVRLFVCVCVSVCVCVVVVVGYSDDSWATARRRRRRLSCSTTLAG